MKQISIAVAIAGLLILLMYPVSTHGKAKGDTIGAPTREFATGTNKGDDVVMATSTGKSVMATSTRQDAPIKTEQEAPSMTEEQQRALIAILMQVLEELLKEANAL
jgi:hypothetical protein